MNDSLDMGAVSNSPRVGVAGWALIALGLAVLVLVGWRTVVSADIWTHVALGRDIYHNGIQRHATLSFALPATTPWVNASWLYDFGVAALWKFKGAKLLTVAHIGAVVLGFLMLSIRLSKSHARGMVWAVGFALGLSAWLLLAGFTPQPALVAVLFTAMFLARVSCGKCRPIAKWVLPVVQVVWANVHASFMLGPLIAVLFAVEAMRTEGRGEQPEVASRKLWIFAAILSVCTFINPYGPGLHAWLVSVWMDPARNMALDPAAAFALEFVPSWLGGGKFAVVAVIGGGLLAIRQRLPVGITGAALLGAFLLLSSSHPTPLCAVLVFPFVAASLLAAAAYVPALVRLATPACWLALLALGALTASGRHLQLLGLASRFGIGIEQDVYPTEAASVIASKAAFPRRVLNIASDGGFLATRLASRDIFCDTRAELYGGAFYDRMARAILGDAKAMQEIEEAYRPGAILINCTWTLAGGAVVALRQSGNWSLCYFDGTSALFVRNTKENIQFTRDRQMQKLGLNKLESARKNYEAGHAARANNAQLVGAGRVFLALGKPAEAESVYRLLTAGAPNMHSAWLGNGIALAQLGRHDEAVTSLTRATAMRPRDPLPLLWLSLAHKGTGQPAEADNAVEKARTLNKDYTDNFLKNPPATRPPSRP